MEADIAAGLTEDWTAVGGVEDDWTAAGVDTAGDDCPVLLAAPETDPDPSP